MHDCVARTAGRSTASGPIEIKSTWRHNNDGAVDWLAIGANTCDAAEIRNEDRHCPCVGRMHGRHAVGASASGVRVALVPHMAVYKDDLRVAFPHASPLPKLLPDP